MKDRADFVRLALAHDQLEGIAHGDKPALAAERLHFSDVADIHDRIAVHSRELRVGQALLDARRV